jgi:multidrug resistance protein, MATE family
VPSGITLALELWCFQLGTVLAGKLGPVPLGAHAIVLSLASLSFMVPLGFSIGAAARVGQLIGGEKSEQAQHVAELTLKLIAAYAACACCLFVLAREYLPRVYSSDARIGSLAAQVLPIAAAFQLFDGLQAGGSGILRGMGRPRITATVNLLGYFACGIPLAYYLGLHTDLGLHGIWLGYAAGLCVVASVLVGTVLRRGPRTVRPLVDEDAERAAAA